MLPAGGVSAQHLGPAACRCCQNSGNNAPRHLCEDEKNEQRKEISTKRVRETKKILRLAAYEVTRGRPRYLPKDKKYEQRKEVRVRETKNLLRFSAL